MIQRISSDNPKSKAGGVMESLRENATNPD